MPARLLTCACHFGRVSANVLNGPEIMRSTVSEYHSEMAMQGEGLKHCVRDHTVKGH